MTSDTPALVEGLVERITVCDGKYTLIMEPGNLRALRYGEEWRDLIGDGFVMALGHEILELKADLTAKDALIAELRRERDEAEAEHIAEADSLRDRAIERTVRAQAAEAQLKSANEAADMIAVERDAWKANALAAHALIKEAGEVVEPLCKRRWALGYFADLHALSAKLNAFLNNSQAMGVDGGES